MQIAGQAKADLNISNGTADATIAPLVTEANGLMT